MGIHQSIMNAAQRSLGAMFPGYFGGSLKRDIYKDFGWPERLSFDVLYQMYQRNGIATAAVDRTTAKTWETHPWLIATQPEDHEDETPEEAAIRRRFDELRVWQTLMEADRRSLVGEYAAVILRIADGQKLDQPAGKVQGLEGLVEVIPAWQGQLTVDEWDTDERSENYGKPSMFSFSESKLGGNGQRQFRVHPSRVIVWSRDGSVFGQSLLQAGFNDLIDMQKISGAGGEGFWKNAKSMPVLEVSENADVRNLAAMFGTTPDQVGDKMNDLVADWQGGFDAALMLQGITAKNINITLPSPEHFHSIPLQSFAASVMMPVKILVGSQTGERASTEDANEWAMTNMSRRRNIVIPNIMMFVRRLEAIGCIDKADWYIDWADLSEASPSEKIERAEKMAAINQSAGLRGQLMFKADEVREAAGYEPLEMPIEDDVFEDEQLPPEVVE